jgi:uncharacterized protein
MKFVLSGKKALVTGATGGFGRGFTRALAARGVTVAISARQVTALNELADEVARAGYPRPIVLEADLGVPGNAAELAARAERALGQVDILFNNAGANVVGTQFALGDNDDARRLFEINYWSPLALIKALVPAMRRRGDGAVLNVTSLAGVAAWVFTGHYSSAKAALSLASDTLRLELNGSGVHVMELMAGPTETALLEGARNTVPGARMGISWSPRGTVEQLSGRVIRALERRQSVLVYPRILRVTPIFPIPSRWVMNFLQRDLDGDPSRLPRDGQPL